MPVISQFYGILVYIYEEELKAAWYAYNEDGELIKIKGLE